MPSSDQQNELLSSDVHENVQSEKYVRLLTSAQLSASEIGVDPQLQRITFSLLSNLQKFDEKTAEESLQSLPIALNVGRVIMDFYGSPSIDPSLVWSGTILHDIGKPAVGKYLIDKSNLGQDWTEDDRILMRGHAGAGAKLAIAAGIPSTTCRAIAEHHNKQYGSAWYGTDPNLNDMERITRDCIAVADFTDAMSTRINTRNAHLTASGRLIEIWNNIGLVFDDYSFGSELSERIYRTVEEDARTAIIHPEFANAA